jgi:hypothetical protein
MSQRRADGATPRPLSLLGLACAAVAAGLLILAVVPAALAHDGSPRLVLEPPQVSPGQVVVVRGEDLGADDEMRLALVGGAGRTELATVTSDGQGHFTVAVQISADAPAGTYSIEAANAAGLSLATPMSISGTPIVAGGGDGAPVGQDEGLPAIVPTPGTASAPGAIAEVRPLPAGTSTASSSIDLVPFVALAGAIGALGLLVWRTRRPPAAAA